MEIKVIVSKNLHLDRQILTAPEGKKQDEQKSYPTKWVYKLV